MGRDLTLYPQKADKKELKDFIESLGFNRCSHLWEWPHGTLNYGWFDNKDFNSIDGVSADIYPVTKEENIYNDNKWALHVRNLYSASLHDVKMLNMVLREARKLFGGTIVGDYGVNTYAPLWEDNSTPMSRGIQKAYNKIFNAMISLSYSLPNENLFKNGSIKTVSQTKKDKEFIKIMRRFDPVRVLYNGLVPFLVSMFEHFFSEVFQILLKYDKNAQKKLIEHRQKIDFQVLLDVVDNHMTIENIVAGNYTFQNINQLNNAYKDWFGIDVRKVLFKKKRVGNSIRFLENKISEIIEYRHGIIHHFELDTSLSKEDFQALLETVKKVIIEFTVYLENKYNIAINKEAL